MTSNSWAYVCALYGLLLPAAGCSSAASPSQPGATGDATSDSVHGVGAGGASSTLAGGADNPSRRTAGSIGGAGASASAAGASAAAVSGAAAVGGGAAVGGAPAVAEPGGPSRAALAFPGALGFGKNATGGRNGSVYHVTSLNDAGPGSFRDAVSVSKRFVVFDVAGYIQLATAVSVESDITIAGQTAPGGGIGFRGGEVSFASSSNIIMRHVRIRPGTETESTKDDALSLYRAQNVMIDHCSFEFGPWNNIDGVSDDWEKHPVTNISIQDSVIADPTGQQFGAHTESVSSQWAWYRNIFANSHNRNPLAKVNTVFVNNLLYNDSAGYTTHTSTSFKHDIVNNYFVFGPASTGTDNTWYQVDKNQAIYSSGNFKDTDLNGTLDGVATMPSWYQGLGTILDSPWSSESSSPPPLAAALAARVAISQAGALPRDAVDSLIIGQVLTLGKGATGLGAGSAGPDGALYTSQAETGLANNGYGSIASGTLLPDADHDGMPDAWELAASSDPSRDDAMSPAGDGYTRIEHYANWLAGPHAISSAGAAVEIDLATYTAGFNGLSPSFAVMQAKNGSVTLNADTHTAHVQPQAGFLGLTSFELSVSAADGGTYTAQVLVLSAP